MKKYYSDVIQFRGTHYDFGYYQGELLKGSPILKNRERQWKPRKHRHFIINPEEFISVMKSILPKILEEIEGLSDALDMDKEEAIRQFGGYYMEYTTSGCSIFMDSDYMVRNYDSHPRGYEGRYLFYQPTDGGYAVIGPSMQITGRIDGMNEKGLVLGYNFTHSKKSNDGFICNMIGRSDGLSLKTVQTLMKRLPYSRRFPTGTPSVTRYWMLAAGHMLLKRLRERLLSENLMCVRIIFIY